MPQFPEEKQNEQKQLELRILSNNGISSPNASSSFTPWNFQPAGARSPFAESTPGSLFGGQTPVRGAATGRFFNSKNTGGSGRFGMGPPDTHATPKRHPAPPHPLIKPVPVLKLPGVALTHQSLVTPLPFKKVSAAPKLIRRNSLVNVHTGEGGGNPNSSTADTADKTDSLPTLVGKQLPTLILNINDEPKTPTPLPLRLSRRPSICSEPQHSPLVLPATAVKAPPAPPLSRAHSQTNEALPDGGRTPTPPPISLAKSESNMLRESPRDEVVKSPALSRHSGSSSGATTPQVNMVAVSRSMNLKRKMDDSQLDDSSDDGLAKIQAHFEGKRMRRIRLEKEQSQRREAMLATPPSSGKYIFMDPRRLTGDLPDNHPLVAAPSRPKAQPKPRAVAPPLERKVRTRSQRGPIPKKLRLEETESEAEAEHGSDDGSESPRLMEESSTEEVQDEKTREKEKTATCKEADVQTTTPKVRASLLTFLNQYY